MLVTLYPWIKAAHLISMVSWMVGLFYLPRLFVYHTEQAKVGDDLDRVFQTMEEKLLRVIMNPAMMATWFFGLLLMAVPGVVDWSAGWFYVKLVCVIGLTVLHMWLAGQRKVFAAGEQQRTGRTWRMINEVPTVLMIVVIVSVVVRPY